MNDIDWKKSHCGVMLCTFEQTFQYMPEIRSILEQVYPLLELDLKDYLVDVKVHMLMPNQFPCIPNWHRDFMPRDDKGLRIKAVPSPLKMYMWLSGPPLTVYRDSVSGKEYTKPALCWHSFTQNDLHRGDVSTEHTWRCFIRIIPKEFVHTTTTNVGTIRRHSQVYLDASKFNW